MVADIAGRPYTTTTGGKYFSLGTTHGSTSELGQIHFHIVFSKYCTTGVAV